MSNQPLQHMRVALSEEVEFGRINVNLEAFIRFDLELDQELNALVDRWSDFTTQLATQQDVRRLRRPKKAK